MKKMFLCILLAVINILSQDLSPQVELFFGTEQASGSITFNLTKQAQVWGGTLPTTNCYINYYLTNLFDYPLYPAPPN